MTAIPLRRANNKPDSNVWDQETQIRLETDTLIHDFVHNLLPSSSY